MVVSVDDALAMCNASSSGDASCDVLLESDTSVSLGIALSPAVAKAWSDQQMNDMKESSRPGISEPFLKRTPSPVGHFGTKRKGEKVTPEREQVMTKRFLRDTKNRNDAFMKEILELRYENESLKAQIRQYRNKVRKIQRISVAAVEREDTMFERANSALERGCITMNGEIKSDAEDDDARNQVVYRAALDQESD